MRIETFLFGSLDVAEDKIFTFPLGLAPFENCTRFTLVHEASDGQTPTSFTLQSLDDAHVALQIADPTLYGCHYELTLNEDEEKLLQVSDPNEIAVMLILFRRDEGGTPIEANLRAPILLNAAKRIGLQKSISHAGEAPASALGQLASAVKH